MVSTRRMTAAACAASVGGSSTSSSDAAEVDALISDIAPSNDAVSEDAAQGVVDKHASAQGISGASNDEPKTDMIREDESSSDQSRSIVASNMATGKKKICNMQPHAEPRATNGTEALSPQTDVQSVAPQGRSKNCSKTTSAQSVPVTERPKRLTRAAAKATKGIKPVIEAKTSLRKAEGKDKALVPSAQGVAIGMKRPRDEAASAEKISLDAVLSRRSARRSQRTVQVSTVAENATPTTSDRQLRTRRKAAAPSADPPIQRGARRKAKAPEPCKPKAEPSAKRRKIHVAETLANKADEEEPQGHARCPTRRVTRAAAAAGAKECGVTRKSDLKGKAKNMANGKGKRKGKGTDFVASKTGSKRRREEDGDDDEVVEAPQQPGPSRLANRRTRRRIDNLVSEQVQADAPVRVHSSGTMQSAKRSGEPSSAALGLCTTDESPVLSSDTATQVAVKEEIRSPILHPSSPPIVKIEEQATPSRQADTSQAVQRDRSPSVVSFFSFMGDSIGLHSDGDLLTPRTPSPSPHGFLYLGDRFDTLSPLPLPPTPPPVPDPEEVGIIIPEYEPEPMLHFVLEEENEEDQADGDVGTAALHYEDSDEESSDLDEGSGEHGTTPDQPHSPGWRRSLAPEPSPSRIEALRAGRVSSCPSPVLSDQAVDD